MGMMNRRKHLIDSYSEMLYRTLEGQLRVGPRSYGFEYEFLPDVFPSADFVDMMEGHLLEMGFEKSHEQLKNDEGMSITFEPGGQIEYQSPPILHGDEELFFDTLQKIDSVNSELHRRTGVSYLAIDYISGRGSAPLCLTSERYRNLHKRVAEADTRGHEMMKGTASIHLHALITDIEEVAFLFNHLYTLSHSKDFAMSNNREEIFRHTDNTRCGNPSWTFTASGSTRELLHNYVTFAIDAVVLGEDLPFYASKKSDFNSFLYHLTTIFTHVRLNLKSSTVELRTLDSMPFEQFQNKWSLFTSSFQEKLS